MLWEFCRYFFRYIIFAKTRQHLLFLAIGGLFISSFALLVLQGTMGGLQHNLISRSKQVLGDGVLILKDLSKNETMKLLHELEKRQLHVVPEYETELLIRYKSHLAPVVVHGVDPKRLPPFLTSLKEAVLGHDLAIELNSQNDDSLLIMAPASTNSFFGDIPRTTTVFMDDTLITDVPEVDRLHMWLRLPVLQNLLRDRRINRIRLYGHLDLNHVLSSYKNVQLKTWEENHKTLVWALKIETSMMLLLFIGMTMLVSFCITLGLMIFFSKIKNDLAGFWIMGSSKNRLIKASMIFLSLINFLSVFSGLVAGGVFLHLLDNYGIEIMPEIFVDRKIPIHLSFSDVVISFFVPYIISFVFSLFSLFQFRKDTSFLSQVRSVG